MLNGLVALGTVESTFVVCPIWGWALTGRNNHWYLESKFKDVQFQSIRASVSASKTVRVLLQKFCNLNKTKHTHCEVPLNICFIEMDAAALIIRRTGPM